MLNYGVVVFFSPHLFVCKVSVLDCCTWQSPGNEVRVVLVGNEVIVVLFSFHATGRKGAGQIQAMLFHTGLGFGSAQWAHAAWARNSIHGGTKPSTSLWEDVSSHLAMIKKCGPSGDAGSSDGWMQGFNVPAHFRFRELVDGGQVCLQPLRPEGTYM